MNKSQAAASRGGGGVTLVVAGAGTGKTTTMIGKIINCINCGIVSPEKTAVMTFSRKAAEELGERLAKNGTSAKGIGFTGTFHSFSLKLLREYSPAYLLMTGRNSFPSLLIDGEKEEAMKAIVMRDPERFLGMPLNAVLNIAENIDRLTPYMAGKLKGSPIYNELLSVNREYAEYKLNKNFIDYEDMVNDASLLLEKKADVRNSVLERFTYIFVDEFQDTSANNLRLLNAIVPDRGRNLFMVGDDFQSIYKFRRAEVSYLINIKEYFPETSIHRLTVNYRSRKEIVSLSNRFIKLNRFRTKKVIRSARGKGGKIFFHSTEDAAGEIKIISSIVEGNSENMETAILFRNNYQGALISKRLHPEFKARTGMMTMHGSKGLEFDVVIIAGVSDSIIPDRGSDIEEERRLFYVAMTRAKEELHLIYYKNRKGILPRFIRELGFRDE
ncbi:MAG TPA: ATP-dependent helicase [Spirochaetota bacterium]|nr:ATP-dependent helicase [Spirochaetota bacterium]HPJ35212.1 ATP-dependent helicase [Spirochaetota bacterium]